MINKIIITTITTSQKRNHHEYHHLLTSQIFYKWEARDLLWQKKEDIHIFFSIGEILHQVLAFSLIFVTFSCVYHKCLCIFPPALQQSRCMAPSDRLFRVGQNRGPCPLLKNDFKTFHHWQRWRIVMPGVCEVFNFFLIRWCTLTTILQLNVACVWIDVLDSNARNNTKTFQGLGCGAVLSNRLHFEVSISDYLFLLIYWYIYSKRVKKILDLRCYAAHRIACFTT